MSFVASPWGKDIAVEPINGVPFRLYVERPRRVASLLDYAPRWGSRAHIVQGDQTLDFAGLYHAVANKAAALAERGVQHGDRVFLLGWNGPAWVVNFWACLRAGAVPVLANAWWSESEITTGVTLLEPRLILADERTAGRVAARERLAPWDIDPTPPAASTPAEANAAASDENETALIIFTSGTSGQPKAVVLSHRAVLARLHMTLHVTRKLPQQIDGSGHDVTLITGPLFHVGGMQTLLRALIVGDTLVFLRGRYDPAEVLESIERQRVQRWNAVPTMVSRLLDHPDVTRRDVGSLKSISIGGAPVTIELMQRIRTSLPTVNPRMPTGYGLTENGGQATAAAGAESIEQLGSTGKPMPLVEIRFLQHPEWPDGEVLLRAPTQMSGYYGIAESPIDADGWLHTGDLGRLDEAGNLWITGRCKDMIIRGGENIAPLAIERALESIAGVVESMVCGVPHPDLGEEVMAIVVTDGSLDAPALREQLRPKVASFALPSFWQLRTERLPTNQTGKVDRAALAAAGRAACLAARASAGT